jgi:hypothetical protein
MKTCRCGQDNEDSSVYCTKCGSRFQLASTQKGVDGWIVCAIMVGVMAIIMIVAQASSHSTGPDTTHTAVSLNDARALEGEYESTAVVWCDDGADDYLRSVSKYDFKWDEIGFLEHKFDMYLTFVSKPGVLVMTTKKAKLQNGLGAYQRIELDCEYDTQAGKVLGYSVRQ